MASDQPTDLSIVRRIHTIAKFTDDEFQGRYRNHDIAIDRERDGSFYIMVRSPSGMLAYDGWWHGSGSMSAAVIEAMRGSLLLKEKSNAHA